MNSNKVHPNDSAMSDSKDDAGREGRGSLSSQPGGSGARTSASGEQRPEGGVRRRTSEEKRSEGGSRRTSVEQKVGETIPEKTPSEQDQAYRKLTKTPEAGTDQEQAHIVVHNPDGITSSPNAQLQGHTISMEEHSSHSMTRLHHRNKGQKSRDNMRMTSHRMLLLPNDGSELQESDSKIKLTASSKLRQLTKQRIYLDMAKLRSNVQELMGEDEEDEEESDRWAEDFRKKIRSNLGFWTLVLYDIQMWWVKKRRNRQKTHEHRLFLKQIRRVEGRFGSGVVSFFVFLRWVIEMNLLLTVIWMTLVVIPNAMFYDRSTVAKSNSTENLYLRNLLDGGLYFKHTTLFYAGYQDNAKGYPIALMYLICIFITYCGGFFMVLRSIASALQDEGDAQSGKHYPFTSLVFTSWDYSLKSRSGSENLSRGIGQSIRDIIQEIDTRRMLEAMSRKQRCTLLTRRIFAWCLSLFLLVTGSASIFILISRDLVAEFKALGLDVTRDSTIVVYTPSVVFVVINVFIPQILFWLPELELYHHGKVQLYVSISRVFVLRMVNLVALLTSLHFKIIENRFDGCAGTLIGQELYRLIVLDTLIQMFMLTVPKYMLFYWTREPDEFGMPPLVLKLLYRQALIWISILVSPLSPLLGAFSMIILFLTAYMMVNKTCKPPSKRWNQPRKSSFFMGLTAATLGFIIIIVSIFVTRSDIIRIGQVGHSPHESCGPFGNEPMVSIYSKWRDSLAGPHPNLFYILKFIFSPTVIGPILFILIAVIYFQTIQIAFEKRRKMEMYNDLVAGQQMERNLIRKLGWELMSKQAETEHEG